MNLRKKINKNQPFTCAHPLQRPLVVNEINSVMISGHPGTLRWLSVGVLPVGQFSRRGRLGISPVDSGCAAIDLALPPR